MNDQKLPLGTNYCLCRACGMYFGGISAFDYHRIDGRCRTVEEMASKGFRLSDRGYMWQDYARPKRPKSSAA